ncbi:hypothetical protein [Pengzhenrongella phosphoraccumulans]|uniref:hypothetical protein n=1 Tax=Pengzhenrongella phosphoraccumulans TaxID=3114394 RepID=UPI00388F210C
MSLPRRFRRPKPATAPAPELALPRVQRAIATHTRLRTRTLPVVPYVIALLLLPALVVTGFMSTGWWAMAGTTATAQAAGGQEGGGQEGGGGDGTAPAAPIAAADIKGSMTVQQVVDAFGVTAAQVFTQFGAEPDLPTSTQLKTLVEGGSGMDIPALRTWLAEPVAG